MNFLIGKFAQSWAKKLVLAGVAFITGAKAAPWLAQFGVTVNPAVLSTGLFGALEGARGWVSHQPWSAKLPGWLLAAL